MNRPRSTLIFDLLLGGLRYQLRACAGRDRETTGTMRKILIASITSTVMALPRREAAASAERAHAPA
jgi:hypothetical protein